jgi:hypothetical protein
VTQQIEALLTDNAKVIIYGHNKFIIHATSICSFKLCLRPGTFYPQIGESKLAILGLSLTLLTNIRIGCKHFPRTNTSTYLSRMSVMKKNSFNVLYNKTLPICNVQIIGRLRSKLVSLLLPVTFIDVENTLAY